MPTIVESLTPQAADLHHVGGVDPVIRFRDRFLPLIDVALIGMRSIERVDANVALVNDTSGRMDLDEVHRHYV